MYVIHTYLPCTTLVLKHVYTDLVNISINSHGYHFYGELTLCSIQGCFINYSMLQFIEFIPSIYLKLCILWPTPPKLSPLGNLWDCLQVPPFRFTLHVSEVMWYLPFCIWLISSTVRPFMVLCCCKHQDFLLLMDVHSAMNMHHISHPLIGWWILRLFPLFAYCKST